MKTILITGTSSGIGLATTKLFSSKGWRVIATVRNPEKAPDELKNIKNIVILPLDLTNKDQIKELAKKVLKDYPIDALYNNAGYAVMGPLEKIPENEMRKMFETDYFGTIFLTQEFIPYFKNKKEGTIIFCSSLASVIGFPMDGFYGAAKRSINSVS